MRLEEMVSEVIQSMGDSEKEIGDEMVASGSKAGLLIRALVALRDGRWGLMVALAKADDSAEGGSVIISTEREFEYYLKEDQCDHDS